MLSFESVGVNLDVPVPFTIPLVDVSFEVWVAYTAKVYYPKFLQMPVFAAEGVRRRRRRVLLVCIT